MPILPENRGRYPSNWEEIRVDVLSRANDCCEGIDEYPICGAVNGHLHPETGSKVQLMIAHMDHTPENCDLMNLKALCQRCHNHYDRDHRRETRSKRHGKA